MKLFASLMLSVVLCGIAAAAPVDFGASQDTHTALSVEMLSSAETGNIHGAGTAGGAGVRHGAPPPVEIIPEPASMALLGIGLGLAALRRRRS